MNSIALKKLRADLGLTQLEFVEHHLGQFNKGIRALQYWEQGIHPVPNYIGIELATLKPEKKK